MSKTVEARVTTAWCFMAAVVGTVLVSDAPCRANGKLAVQSIKLLSEHGSTRATFYTMSNKIVTRDGKTHVAWLDRRADTMISTYDHATDSWTPPVKVGTGKDNHSGPALTCDSKGYLHIIFGPHGGPFQYCRSKKPNDSAEWVKMGRFGVRGTYPSVVCDDQDTLHIAYRGGKWPYKLIYQRLSQEGNWSKPTLMAKTPGKGYTAYGQTLAIARDNSLHLGYMLFYGAAGGRQVRWAGYLMSRDRGATWTLADGSKVDLPVTPASDAFFRTVDGTLGGSTVVCDSKSRPWLLIGVTDQGKKAYQEIHHYDGKKWHRIRLQDHVVPKDQGEKITGIGPITIDSNDRIYVPALVGEQVRAGTMGDVVVLCSEDRGKTFRTVKIFPPDGKLPHRGLNIERPTGHHVVEVPWVLFCTGKKGRGNADWNLDVANTVRAVRLAWEQEAVRKQQLPVQIIGGTPCCSNAR